MLASFAAWIAHFFLLLVFFFFNDTATTEIYTLSLHDALPICGHRQAPLSKGTLEGHVIECPLHFATFDVRTGKLLSGPDRKSTRLNSSHLVISYAVFCLKKKKNTTVNRATSSPDHSPTDSSLT